MSAHLSTWISEHLTRDFASPVILRRAKRSHAMGQVLSVERLDDGEMVAQVEGTGLSPWVVRVRIEAGQLVHHCGCAYTRGPCKHVVSALLAYRDKVEDGEIVERDGGGDAGATARLDASSPPRAVVRWASERGVLPWLDAPVAAIPPLLKERAAPPREYHDRHGSRLFDLLDRRRPGIRGSDALVGDILRFLEQRAEADARWRAGRDPAAWRAGDDDRVAPVVARLHGLRAALLETDAEPREPQARGGVDVAIERWPTALRLTLRPAPWADTLPAYQREGLTVAHAVVVPLVVGDVRLEGSGASGPAAGTLLLEAIEHALAILTQPEHEAIAARVRRELATPMWRRALEALHGAADAARGEVFASDDRGALGWRVTASGDGHGVEGLEPVLVRPAKRGDGVVLRSLSAQTLAADHRRWPHPGDRAALGLMAGGPWYEGHEPLRAALRRLVGHPRVFLRADKARVEVRAAELAQAVRAEADGEGALELGFELDGRWLDAAAVRAMVAAQDVALWVDREREALQVIDVAPELHGVLAAIDEFGAILPVEAVPGYLEYATSVSGRSPLRLPSSLAGAAVKAERDVTLRLEATAGGRLTATLVTRPMAGGASERPGQGPRVLYGRIDGEVVHCERELDAEVAAAEAVAARLRLAERPPFEPFGWIITELDEALALLADARVAGIPTEWAGEARWRVAGSVGASDLRIELTGGGRDWFSLRGAATLGEVEVPLEAMLRAIRERRRFVRVDEGLWVELDARLRRRLAPVAVSREEGRVAAVAAPLVAALEDDGVTLEGSADWLERRARLEEAATLEVPVPDGLAAALRPYQRDGLTWLGRIAHWSTGACLADDMGLGKTVQALGLMLRRGDVGPQLVVAPTSLGFNWRREAARFAPSLTLSSFRGRHHLELLEGTLGPGEVVVTSYDLLARYGEQLGAHRWATVVLDEAQAIKNPATRRARSAFALAAEFVLALTGTPVENRSGEVWSLFRAIAPGLLGSSADFRRAFALPIERDRSAEARQGLAGIIRPFVLRRLKSEVARELPPRTEVEVGVELSGAERHLYEELRAAAASALAGAEGVASNQRRFLALQALTRLRQLACHPRLVDPRSAVASSKLAVLRELVSELRDEGHRVLVFSQFVSLLALVREAFEADGVSYRYLDGSTPEARRREEIDAFQQGGADVFLLSLKAGGTGLNLTAADYVIHLDPWWNPAVEDQATDRAHRIGQDKPVTVLRLISQGTVEEGIMALHADKRALADALLSGAGAGQSLSVEELTALISGAWEHGEREAEQTQAPPGPPADP